MIENRNSAIIEPSIDGEQLIYNLSDISICLKKSTIQQLDTETLKHTNKQSKISNKDVLAMFLSSDAKGIKNFTITQHNITKNLILVFDAYTFLFLHPSSFKNFTDKDNVLNYSKLKWFIVSVLTDTFPI